MRDNKDDKVDRLGVPQADETESDGKSDGRPIPPIPHPLVQFDYTNQAWVEDGKYVRCGHATPCKCFGRAHEGEPVRVDAELR